MKITREENNIRIMKELGERVQDLRISEALKQSDLAKHAGVSKKTVERLENGENTSLFNFLNVMRALGVLDNVEVLLPQKRIAPKELHERGKKRRRVTDRQKQQEIIPFQWNEDKG